MSSGDFTKEEADATQEALEELYRAMSKRKKMEFLGHVNDIALFIAAAKKAAPTEEERGSGT